MHGSIYLNMFLFRTFIFAILAAAVANAQVVGVYGPCEGPVHSVWLSCGTANVISCVEILLFVDIFAN